MATANTFNVAGTNATIIDQTARTEAGQASAASEYARQMDGDLYAGQSLAALFAGEIASHASPWHWLRARARSNNFTGIRIKDYIDLTLTNGNNMRYRVGAIDPYYNCGDTAKGHHFAMVPDAPAVVTGDYAINGSYLYWNTTNTNQGTADEKHPYLCSNLHAWELNAFYPMLPQNVRDSILPHRVLLEERYSASGTLTDSNSWSWADLGAVWSLSEVEVYGQNVWSKPGYATGFDCQFPIFKQTKDRIMGGRVSWWLRSAMGGSSSGVCYVNSHGYADYTSPTNTWVRPRPCFLVG